MSASEKTVTLSMPEETAEEFISALADVLCWHRGFASSARSRYHPPPGIDDLNLINIKLKTALARARKEAS